MSGDARDNRFDRLHHLAGSVVLCLVIWVGGRHLLTSDVSSDLSDTAQRKLASAITEVPEWPSPWPACPKVLKIGTGCDYLSNVPEDVKRVIESIMSDKDKMGLKDDDRDKERVRVKLTVLYETLMRVRPTRSLLSTVCCLLSAVCCLLSAVCCLLSSHAACFLLPYVCYLLPTICCLQSALYWLLSANSFLRHAVCCLTLCLLSSPCFLAVYLVSYVCKIPLL
jgi:hypothetical protein